MHDDDHNPDGTNAENDAPAEPDVIGSEMRRAIEAIVLVAHEPVPVELLAQLLE